MDVAVAPDKVPAELTHRISYRPPDSQNAALVGTLDTTGPEVVVGNRFPCQHRLAATISPHNACCDCCPRRWVVTKSNYPWTFPRTNAPTRTDPPPPT